jgi:hypothetical protein
MNNWITTPSQKCQGSPKKDPKNDSRKNPRISSPPKENRFSALDEESSINQEDVEMKDVETAESSSHPTSEPLPNKTNPKKPSPDWSADSDEDTASSDTSNKNNPLLTQQPAAPAPAQYHDQAGQGSAPT